VIKRKAKDAEHNYRVTGAMIENKYEVGSWGWTRLANNLRNTCIESWQDSKDEQKDLLNIHHVRCS